MEVPPDPYSCMYCMPAPPRPNYQEPPACSETLPCCRYRCCAGSYALARNWYIQENLRTKQCAATTD